MLVSQSVKNFLDLWCCLSVSAGFGTDHRACFRRQPELCSNIGSVTRVLYPVHGVHSEKRRHYFRYTNDTTHQVFISDEEIERDILEAYRPLSSPDGVRNWTTIGPYSVIFRRLLGQREVWVETPVYHFSVTANAKKVDKAGKDQSYYYGDLGGLRWWFKGRSSSPRVRFGNTTKASKYSFFYRWHVT